MVTTERTDKANGAPHNVDLQAALAEASRSGVKRLHCLVKRDIPSQSFFRFIGSDFLRVRRFGRRSYVLDARLLPPGIRMNRLLTDFLSTRVRSLGRDISQRLAPVMEMGWLHLTPRQYNMLALLKRLADRLRDYDFTRLDIRRRNAIDRLRGIESLFLMLHCDPRSLQIISSALRLVGEEETMGLVLQILAEDCTIPSLYNCVLGLNMLKHRRYLSLRDLMPDDAGEVVDISRFQFERTVRRRVENVVGDTRESLKIMHGRLAEVRGISGYVPINGQGRATLQAVYDSVFPRPASSFDTDLQNLVIFAVRLLKSFEFIFAPLLNGQLAIEERGRVSVFPPSLFGKDLTRLRELIDRLEIESSQSTRLPLARYLRIKQGRLQPIGDEMEICQLIDQSASCLVDLGRSVLTVLGPRRSPGAADTFPSFDGLHVRTRTLLDGLTVQEALSHVVSVCFSAGVLLEDTILTMLLARERKLQIEIRHRMTFLERVLDPKSYQEIRAVLP